MGTKKISAMSEVPVVSDPDEMVVVSEGATQKITIETLKDSTFLSWDGDLTGNATIQGDVTLSGIISGSGATIQGDVTLSGIISGSGASGLQIDGTGDMSSGAMVRTIIMKDLPTSSMNLQEGTLWVNSESFLLVVPGEEGE